MIVVSNLVNGVNCGFPLTFSVLVTLITQGLCVTQPRMRTLVVRCMQIVNPLSSGCGAIDTEGTSVGRAAAEVCGSLEAGVCQPGVVSLFDSGPSVEEAPLHIPNSAPMLNTQHYHTTAELLLLVLQSNPLKCTALRPDYEYPLRQRIHLSMFYTLHCV